jgi:hypothetical protein
MGAFTGQKPKNTYDSILHVESNDSLSVSLQYIQDGLGNNSTIRVSTNGVELTNTTLAGTLSLSSPLSIANGGFGVVLTDPNADRIVFWDDSAGQYQYLELGSNISITGTTLDVTASSGGITWDVVSGTTQIATVNKGYLTNNAGLVTVTLPPTFAVGDIIEIAGMGAGGWKLEQNSGQQIHFGDMSTTAGTGGYLSSTHNRDTIRILGCVANTELMVLSSHGNITMV